MSTTDRTALQTIFSFFLGLMVVAFIGVGVNTFFPSPEGKYRKSMQETSRKQESLARRAPPGGLSLAEQARIDSLAEEQMRLSERQQAEMKDWARVTSIVLVIFATLALVISLVRSDQLRVISNGLLLGGLFTMLYGVGWSIFSGNSVTRFVVILFALAVAIGLGYVKFVRRKREREAREAELPTGTEAPARWATTGGGTVAVGGGTTGAVSGPALDALSARVAALEERATAAAAALSGEVGSRR